MALTWNDFTMLPPAQRAKLEQFRQIGLQFSPGLNRPGGDPDISMVNDNQAKQAAQWLSQELMALERPTEAGVRYVREFYKGQAAQSYEDSVVPGP